MIDADFGDLIDYLGNDPEVNSIVPYMEGVGAVFRNVLNNALEAMPEGGTLTIKAENFRIDNETQYGGITLNPGDYVHISIQD